MPPQGAAGVAGSADQDGDSKDERIRQLEEQLAQAQALVRQLEAAKQQSKKDEAIREMEEAFVPHYEETKKFKDLLNIPMPTLFGAIESSGSVVISGPEQHDKTNIMIGLAAANCNKEGPRAPAVVIQRDVKANVQNTQEKMSIKLLTEPFRANTMYVSGEKGISSKVMQDIDVASRFRRGTMVPVLPGYSNALQGLNAAMASHGLHGMVVLMDEADALMRNWVDFKKIRSMGELALAVEHGQVRLTKLEFQLYQLLGIPQLDDHGNLRGPALGPEQTVRSLFWVSATHLPTIMAHVMWGLPFKYHSMDMQLLTEKKYTMYKDLTPLKDHRGAEVYLEADDYAEATALQGNKVAAMFREFVKDVTRQDGPEGYKGSKCMMLVAVTRRVNKGEPNTRDVMRRCFELYDQFNTPRMGAGPSGMAVRGPSPVIIAVVGPGCVVASSAADIPAEIDKTTVVRKPPAGKGAQSSTTQGGTSDGVAGNGATSDGNGSGGGACGRSSSDCGAPAGDDASSGATAGGPSTSVAAEQPPAKKARKSRLPPRLKVHEVIAQLAASQEYQDRPFIVVGMTCVGRSVSVRGGDRVLTHMIVAPGQVPSSDLSQLLMRGAGNTSTVRVGLNKFTGGIKVLIREEDYQLVQELYPFTQELGRRLSELNGPVSPDQLRQAVRAVFDASPAKYLAVRSTTRPHVTRRLDPLGILANSLADEDEEDEEEIEDWEDEDEDEDS